MRSCLAMEWFGVRVLVCVWLRRDSDTGMKQLIALIVSCSSMSVTALEPTVERRFEDAVQLIKEAKLVYPGYHLGRKDDREGLLRYDEAGKVVLGVAKTEPEKIREILNVLVSEVERLAWDDYTEVAKGYKINLVKALGHLGDPTLLNFFLGQCRYGAYAADGLSRLSRDLSQVTNRILRRGPQARLPTCIQAALTMLAERTRDVNPRSPIGHSRIDEDIGPYYNLRDYYIRVIKSHLDANAKYMRDSGEYKDVESIIEQDRQWIEALEDIIYAISARGFEDAVQVVKEKKLLSPGLYMGRKDDREGFSRYHEAGVVILEVAKREPAKIWKIRDLLLSEVERLDWNDYNEMAIKYKLHLVSALSYLKDPSLLTFLLDQCWQATSVNKDLSRLGKGFVDRAIEELRPGPPKAKYTGCIKMSLIMLARRIKAEDPIYTVADRSILREMLKTEVLPAAKAYEHANAKYKRESGKYTNVEKHIESDRKWVEVLEGEIND